MRIEKFISDLLFEHDCVIIPGLGGFIGNYQPARIDTFHHTFHPPSKSLLFNVNLRQNDGLLASRLADECGITYEEAVSELGRFAEHCNSLLKSGKHVLIENVGELIADPEGNIQFEQETEVNYLDESFGMHSFISLPIHREVTQGRIERKISRYIDPAGTKRRILPKSLKWAAALIIPLGTAAFLGITQFDQIRNIPLSYSSLLSPSVNTMPASTPAPDKVTMTIPSTGRASSEKPVIAPVSEPKQVASISHDQTGPFSIIVGAFKVRENAERFVSKLIREGHNATIVDQTKTGLYRVSIDSYSIREEALEGLSTIRVKGYPAAWLLEK